MLNIPSGASAIIAEGEVMQLRSANDLSVTEDHYMNVVSAKTALFAAAAEGGAVLAGQDLDFIQGFRAYGENLGIAFQLVDDALDYPGPLQVLTRNRWATHFREAKMTLPIILAHARADDAARAFWQRVIETGNQSEADLNHAITLVEQTGAIQETMRRARTYADLAKAALAILPESEIKHALSDIADFCVERAY